jgi:hypothetical protein
MQNGKSEMVDRRTPDLLQEGSVFHRNFAFCFLNFELP